MDKRLLVLMVVVSFILALISFPDGAAAALLVLLLSFVVILILRRYSDEKVLITNIFLIGLVARIGLGIFIEIFDLQSVMGPDSAYYHDMAKRLAEIWWEMPVPDDLLTYRALNPGGSGWGMNYLFGSIYFIFGPGLLIAQSFCGVIGAATAPMAYFCAEKVFNNKRVSKYTAISIALFPSFVIWSAQLLKDGLIIFLLVCIMTALLQLQKKISLTLLIFMLFSLFGIFALRFYIFYMVAISVVGSFFIGTGTTKQSIARNIVIVVLLGVVLTYFGVANTATKDIEYFGNLEIIQQSRRDLSQSADSGFGENIDVSTPVGALAALPIGLLYLYLAPFPWEINKFSQLTVLPETMLWWAMIPLLIIGLRYSLTNRFRAALPITLFSFMLTLLYSLFQGNVGMLYRQRTQVQVFLFMFIAVGIVIIEERKENKKIKRQLKQEQLMDKLRSLGERENY